MDTWTIGQHLSSYVDQVITRDDQVPFLDYAAEHIADEEGQTYWSDKGWDALYVQWLKLNQRY